MAAANASQGSNPFIKQLASSDRRVRDRALSSLRTYLARAKPFSDLEFLKLWKGLFFCMWMSDKARVQQQLARDLAGLVDVLHCKENFLGFVHAFWKTMGQQWGGIESLRMDKFMYLVRCYVNKGFEHVSKKGWADEELIEKYLEVLRDVPFNPRDPKIPNGLRYHVVDIYVDELDKVDTGRDCPLEKLVEPLRKLEKESVTSTVRKRVGEALEDERLEDWQNENVDDDADSDEEDQQLNGGGVAPAREDDGSDFGGFDD